MKRIIRLLVILFVGLFLAIRWFSAPEEQLQESFEETIPCYEGEETDSVALPEIKKLHYRSWQEYLDNEIYCADYSVSSRQQDLSKGFRVNVAVDENSYFEEFWGHLYSELYHHDQSLLAFIQDSLKDVAIANQLEGGDFARFVVSFVQDIPYQYVLPENCNGNEKFPCNPNIRYGIFSPVEFLYSLSGDCDTRTVLLYTLLKNFGYDPVIVNSYEYRHSMLALDIPASGDYFNYRGKRYYFWETTNTGWLPGMVPPTMNNYNYWKVVLD